MFDVEFGRLGVTAGYIECRGGYRFYCREREFLGCHVSFASCNHDIYPPIYRFYY